MISITQALYNVLHSRYGRDVRQSIHDAIYQINENANEAVQTAKAMGVGTDISSPTDSSAGYVAGNLYLNSSTWDLWQCIGTNSWLNKGNIKGAQGIAGVDGTNNYIHVRYSANYDGTDYTVAPTASTKYMGIYYGANATAPSNKADYLWTSIVGASGTSAYVYIMYSENADGTGFVNVPTPLCKYIGFYAGSLSSPPANKAYYTWSEYVGKSGTGTGDMLKADYDSDGNGAVDKADRVGMADTAVLEKFSEVGGKVKYNGADIGADPDNTTIGKNSSGQLEVEKAILDKLPTTTPTTTDAGKAPVVQPDGSVAWAETKGGHDMLSTVAAVEAITSPTDDHVASAYVIKNYANRYTNSVIATLTANNNQVSFTDSILQDDNATFEFFFEPKQNADGEYEYLTLAGYTLDTSAGTMTIEVVDAPTVNTRVRIDVSTYRA